MNSTLAEPSLSSISQNHDLVGIGVGSIGIEDEEEYDEPSGSGRIPVKVFKRSTHVLQMAEWLRECCADVVLVYTFNFRICQECLDIPKFGFFNFHPGSLPRDRGNPLFWTILHGNKECTLSVHRMTERIDDGPIYSRLRYPIDADTTFGAALAELARGAEQLSLQLLEDLELHGSNLLLECQAKADSKYYPRPDASHTQIDWERQSSVEIQALVNACNPYCEGALAMVEGRRMRVLEVTCLEVVEPLASVPFGVPLPVATGDLCFKCRGGSTVRVDVVYDSDEYCSGRKWLRKRAVRNFNALKI